MFHMQNKASVASAKASLRGHRVEALCPDGGFPAVFFDKCIGRKRNVGGGVLADLSTFGWQVEETSAVLRFFKLTSQVSAARSGHDGVLGTLSKMMT